MNDFYVDKVRNYIGGRRVVILGFGREGKSSLSFFKENLPDIQLVVADRNPDAFSGFGDSDAEFFAGKDYIDIIKAGDFVMKSPGISFRDFTPPAGVLISSQTDLFLFLFGKQITGVTGTKGKSTTVTLIHSILSHYFGDVKLVGNIGTPALDIAGEIGSETKVVYELSSHQLEFTGTSPHIAVLLNLFEEHLDHYKGYESYRNAKWQIAAHQDEGDFFIYNACNDTLSADMKKTERGRGRRIAVSVGCDSAAGVFFDGSEIFFNGKSLGFQRERFKPAGDHNVFNLMTALAVAGISGIDAKEALETAYEFGGLPHRLEFVGNYGGIDFYNDSIATIPQAAVNALKTVENVATVILGGINRGINYDLLVDYLADSGPLNIMLVGDVGKMLKERLKAADYKGRVVFHECFDEAVRTAVEVTPAGKACLLSPAAASYDKFRNFEERGDRFKEIVKGKD